MAADGERSAALHRRAALAHGARGEAVQVSEFNHPLPNEWLAEGIPIAAAYGAFQDCDAIIVYTFEPKRDPAWKSYVGDPCDISLNPVRMTQMATGALDGAGRPIGAPMAARRTAAALTLPSGSPITTWYLVRVERRWRKAGAPTSLRPVAVGRSGPNIPHPQPIPRRAHRRMQDPLKVPDIGKYHILELVGEGAMGVVYKAKDSVLDRTVAVKVMNDAIARQDELRTRFLREAQAAASLQHPNVVSIYDLGEVDGHLYIAMEFVQGADLEALMQTHEPLSLQEKLDIIIDVLTGLTFAHKRGIVHRDIKPANIRIAEDGRAKLMDFGVAHLTSSQLTSTGASLGTPVYMSPEQITGGKATPATDVFAVGAVLYELLTGNKPFDSQTLQGLFYKILTEKPTPIREVMPGLPSALDHIVEKAMAKDAEDRYQSALDMANDLSGVRSMLSGPGYPSSVSLSATVEHAIRRSQQAAKVRMVRRELIAGGVLATALVIALAWWQLGKGRAPAETAVSSTTRTLPAAPDSAGPAAGARGTPVATAPTPPATAARVDSASRAPVADPAPKQADRSAPKPERPTPGERVARNASPPQATKAATSTARQAVTPPSRSAVASGAPPATVAAAPQVVTSPPPVTQPAITQPTVQQGIAAPRPVAPSAQTAPPPAEAPPPAPPTASDVAPLLEAYARAIESRDVSAIRRVYPGLTPDQQRGFEQFFESARKINVTFRVASVDGTPSTADVRVTGRYEYESSAGRAERSTVAFAAAVRKDGSTWRLVSVR